jgi:hypothetical protein
MPIFSNEVAEPLETLKKAWLVVLKADGDPHWRDLRHEYASTLVERGVPLAQVRDLPGHASILTTERYDNRKLEALQAAVERLEGGKKFDTTDAGDRVSSSFQVSVDQQFADSADAARKILRSN